MVPLTPGEFEDNPRQFFWAERTSAGDVRRLYDYFAEFAADRARVDGQEASLFAIENADPVSGTRWWELRHDIITQSPSQLELRPAASSTRLRLTRASEPGG